MPTADARPDACCPIPIRPLLVGAAIGLALAVAWTLWRGPVYEATAYLEAGSESGLPTLEEKLRFPSLYRQVAASDDEARDLARRTRVKTRRGSRILAVTVTHSEPANAATEADRIAEVFLASQTAPATAKKIELPDPLAADSPESLLAAWETQSAEFEKLSTRYENDAAHPAVAGARQRLDALAKRIGERVSELRAQLGLAPSETGADPGQQLQDLQGILENLTPSDAGGNAVSNAFPAATPCRLAESATVPLDPVGPGRIAIWIGGLALGAFAAGLWRWCCPAEK